MSFVCEKCGWRDDPRWRNTYWDPHTSIMNWTDFEKIYPEMAQKLQWNRHIQEGPYMYERTPLKWPPRLVVRGTIEVWKTREGASGYGFRHKGKMERPGRKKILNPKTGPEKHHPREIIKNWV